MDQKRISSVWVALMGVLIGVLLAITWQSALRSPTRKIRVGASSKIDLVLDQIQKRYVDTVDTGKLTEAAIVAALAELDPHSVYMPPVLLEESETELAGNFDGIGIQFNVPNDTAIVLEVIPGGPSEKIGLLPGDRILRVDDKTIAGVQFPQDSMVRRMKGPAGTKVLITVRRDGEDIPFEITRGKIPVHCVDAAFMVNDTTGYIRLSKFTRTTFNEVSHATTALMDEGMKRLIFDLRDNTGGYFDQSLLLCNQFLPKGASIVYMEGLHQKREEYKADGNGMFQQVNLVVLINENSASSSEIFAGAIQDNDRGLLVGRRSFGKGLVQNVRNVAFGGHVKVTTSKYYLPSGRCIQAIDYSERQKGHELKRDTAGGIEPDIVLSDSAKVDVTYSLYVDHYFFDYATRFHREHDSIAPPETFEVTDEVLEDFCRFLDEKGFTYETETSKFFADMLKMAEHEDIDSTTLARLKALEPELQPDFRDAIARNKEEVKQLLGAEIVLRYYYQKGQAAYQLRFDDELKRALQETR
jgi:carboxyl-terminal processing protease